MVLEQVIRHETLTGEWLEFPVHDQVLLAFLNRLHELTDRPQTTVEELTTLVWSADNPLLQPLLTDPTRAVATRETYEHPAWRMMLDLIDRRRAKAGELDPERARARYTMSVDQAAERLQIDPATVRRAIREGRLAAWKEGGMYRLDPTSVDSYAVTNRGRRAEVQISSGGRGAPIDAELLQQADEGLLPGALAVREGTRGNFSLRVKGAVKNPPHGQNELSPIRQYLITPPWREVAVLRTKKAENDHRLFILRPRKEEDPDKDQGLTFAGFYVRGNFEVVEKVNNPREALERWKSYDNTEAPFTRPPKRKAR